MNFVVDGFDWDDGNRDKCQVHGLSMEEIESFFAEHPRIAPDPKHSAGEDCWIAVGRTGGGRPAFVAFTIRTKSNRRLVRPVTARYMHAREAAAYEKAFQKESSEIEDG